MIVFAAPRRRGASVLAACLRPRSSAGAAEVMGTSDQQLVTQALRSYLRAQAAGDGQAACALLTAGGQKAADRARRQGRRRA